MGKKSGKSEPTKVDQVYVLGLDANGKPRAARFPKILEPSPRAGVADRELFRLGEWGALGAIYRTTGSLKPVRDVRFGALYGLMSDIAACPKSAKLRSR
jgi:hypothetical protein